MVLKAIKFYTSTEGRIDEETDTYVRIEADGYYNAPVIKSI